MNAKGGSFLDMAAYLAQRGVPKGAIIQAHKRLYQKHGTSATRAGRIVARSLLQTAKNIGKRIRLSKRGRSAFAGMRLDRKKRSDAGKKRGKRNKATAAAVAAVLPAVVQAAAAAAPRRSARLRGRR